MTPLYLSIMSWGSRSDKRMKDAFFFAVNIKGMFFPCIHGVCEFSSVVRLNDFRPVLKVMKCHLYKLNRRVRALLSERINKPLSACFINDGILIERIRKRTLITMLWNIFYIKLPFNTNFFRGMVELRDIRFLFFFLILKNP